MRKSYLSTVGRKFPIGNVEKGFFLSVYVDDIKLAGEKKDGSDVESSQ